MEFEKYHKIKLLGDEDNKGIFDDPDDEIIIEEKVDDGNFRFMIKDGQLIFGSRTSELDENNGNLKAFHRCIEYVRKNVDGSVYNLDGFIFYGECMIKHTMDYDWEKIPPYLGFDIKSEGKYLGYEDKCNFFANLGLIVVPLIDRVKAKSIKEFTDENVPKSVFASPSSKDQQAEGVVIKNYKKQLFSKYVRAKFKEKSIETFGGGRKWATDDEGRIVAIYCTNARIDKMIFKLVDEGVKLEMPMMEHLPKRVIGDIFEECWKEICYSSWSINFKTIRKKITSRCLHVLQQVIVNNSLGKKDAK